MSTTLSRRGDSRVCVIFNPTAKGERARRAIAKLHALESDCALKPSLAAGAARRLATEAVQEGFEIVAAMGGDGTVHEILNGIADVPDGFSRVRLGVLPVGTVNVFARELAIPLRFENAWRVLSQGREKVVDVPEMEFQTAYGREKRWFAQMAGCGLDARAVELLNWNLKKRIGQLAYVVSGMQALREKPVLLEVTADGRKVNGALVLLGNGRFYGGSIPVFQAAELQDGLLDVCVFPKVNWWVVLRYALAFLSPRLLQRSTEQHLQAAQVTITSSSPVGVQLDGELVGRTPAVCQLHRRRLRVVVP